MDKLTICGGGNAVHVLVPLANQAGWQVDVFAPFADEARRLWAGMNRQDGVEAHFADGAILRGHVRCISANATEVVPESSLILLALPAHAHGRTLEAIAPYVGDDITIAALPARGGFDMQTRSLLDRRARSVTIGGLQTLPWVCRTASYGEKVSISGTKARVGMAVSPSTTAKETMTALRRLLRVDLQLLSSFLSLTLANTGQIIHPGIMYGLCHGREDETFPDDDVPLFYQGVDRFTCHILQSLSDEVQVIARALAEELHSFNPDEVPSLYDWLLSSYPNVVSDNSSLQSAFTSNRAYTGLRLPVRPVGGGRHAIDFQTRYLSEDVPCGLVVVRGIAELASVRTPAIDTVITWAQERLGKRYLEYGYLSGPDIVDSRAPQAFGFTKLSQLQMQLGRV